MKRRLALLLTATALTCCMFTACEEGTEANSADTTAMNLGTFKTIEGKESLVYNAETGIVYYMFSTRDHEDEFGYGYSYFAPYISANGKFCRYTDDTIIEINNN